VLWKSRVNLIKQARQLMTQKAFSEAAMTYEKYLRILEIIFEVPKGDLSPAVFSNDPRSKELTVVTSVYWDLMRIYDSSTRHAERMNKTAIKCAEFARFSPLFPDIVKKAEAFQHSAKNPAAVRSFLIAANSSRPRCFIATEVFGPASPEVQTLRRFRDDILRLTPIGRQLVVIYYRHSPTIARALRASAIARASVRPFLRLIAAAVSFLLKR
jgi:hypothetical protein